MEITLTYEVVHILLSFVLVAYCSWLCLKRRDRHFVYLTLGFAFLALSILIQELSSTWWTYVMQFGIHYRFLELATLAFFACFVICIAIAFEKWDRLSNAGLYSSSPSS